MKKSSSQTGIVVIVIVIVLAIVGYFYVQGGSSSNTSSSSGLVADQQNGDVGLAEVNLLNQIQNIPIDTSLFLDPAYMSLVDHTISIPAEAVGRKNPFAPIPGVGNPNAVVNAVVTGTTGK